MECLTITQIKFLQLRFMLCEMVESEEWITIYSAIDDLMTYYDIDDDTIFWEALEGTQYCKKQNNPVIGFMKHKPFKRVSLVIDTRGVLEKVFRRCIKKGMGPIDVVHGLALALNTDIEAVAGKLKKITTHYLDKMDKENGYEH